MTSDKSAAVPDWYKDAIIYELRVRSFSDADSDGVGDFRGLTAKLDYLAELGVTALWLLPFYPSPLRDDGYDISDYTAIHPDCGTLADFKEFLAAAHDRGMRVITELVLNHTSDQHPWFQRARRAGAPAAHRDYYVWSDRPDRFQDARIIFKDFEPSNWAWDPVARGHYWHRFFSHQPDLNFDNPHVREEMIKILDFWLDLGVDGLRLDAIPYLFEREGTNCENLPETHSFLRELRAHVDKRYPGRMLLAEANQWPDDAVAYFGVGNECHMAFHFPVMPRMFMSIHREDRSPLVEVFEQTPSIPESCQWALFLRNHDELTLEMVTDEERDYMNKVYATDPVARINLGIRRRLAPLLGNHRRKIELMNGLLFSLPGTPVLYYGDEIGMGDNMYLGDRNGVRTPMQWSSDKNAGFSRANPQRLLLPIIIDPEYHYEAINVEAQDENPHSLLQWTKRLIALRKRTSCFGRGTTRFLQPANNKILAYVREWKDERVLVVANLSRFVQHVELDLSAWQGLRPVEMFGRVPFPVASTQPYFLSLGPHSFYWFSLEAAQAPVTEVSSDHMPDITVTRPSEIWDARGRGAVEPAIARFAKNQPWFVGHSQAIRSQRLLGAVPMSGNEDSWMAFLGITYLEGGTDTLNIPVRFLTSDAARRFREAHPDRIVAAVRTETCPDGVCVLYEAADDPALFAQVLDDMGRGKKIPVGGGSLTFRAEAGRRIPAVNGKPLARHEMPNRTRVETEGNVAFVWLRCLDEAPEAEMEILRKLAELEFPGVPRPLGSIEWREPDHVGTAVALAYEMPPATLEAWDLFSSAFRRYVESGRMDSAAEAAADRLGRRLAELHSALASDAHDPAFRPEPFTPFSQRSLYQALTTRIEKTFGYLARHLDIVSADGRLSDRDVTEWRSRAKTLVHGLRERSLRADQIRCHGDMSLRSIRFDGDTPVFVDLAGDPYRSNADRRRRRCTLRELASLRRSLERVGRIVLVENGGAADRSLRDKVAEGANTVARRLSDSYVKAAGSAPFVSRDADEWGWLLKLFRLQLLLIEIERLSELHPDRVAEPVEELRRTFETGEL